MAKPKRARWRPVGTPTNFSMRPGMARFFLFCTSMATKLPTRRCCPESAKTNCPAFCMAMVTIPISSKARSPWRFIERWPEHWIRSWRRSARSSAWHGKPTRGNRWSDLLGRCWYYARQKAGQDPSSSMAFRWRALGAPISYRSPGSTNHSTFYSFRLGWKATVPMSCSTLMAHCCPRSQRWLPQGVDA
ncbi:hypothetical protein D9M71_574410 [compost metagenome]